MLGIVKLYFEMLASYLLSSTVTYIQNDNGLYMCLNSHLCFRLCSVVVDHNKYVFQTHDPG